MSNECEVMIPFTQLLIKSFTLGSEARVWGQIASITDSKHLFLKPEIHNYEKPNLHANG